MAIALDINFADVLEARKRLLEEKALGVQGNGIWGTMVADITALPFKNNVFDVVICSEILEHVPHQEAAVHEVTRVVRPGKDVVVSVPRYLPERICWALSSDYHNAHSLHTPYWWLKCLVGPTRNDSSLVNLYHRFLVWGIMKRSRMMRWLEHLLNPLLGKSLVLYLRKGKHA
jgi:ubiquinone/menaquinone biosynthesis C-methylase UbiE